MAQKNRYSRLSQNVGLLFVILLCSSCAHNATRWVKRQIIPNTNSYTLTVGKKAHNSDIRIMYTGCGGLVIFKGNEGLMTDPYYTGHRWWKTPAKKIDPKNDQRVRDSINNMKAGTNKDIKTVLISHAHYDHIEDLPYLLDNKLLADEIKLIGDTSAWKTVETFTQTKVDFISAEDNVYNQPPKPLTPVKWIRISDHMRVMVIEGDHAPHYRNMHLMRGKTDTVPFKNPTDKSCLFKWREGHTYSFIIDVMDDAFEKPELRLFIQSSSCEPPYGFPPEEVLKEKAVDVAFMGVASSDWVKPYPEDILKHLRPEKIVLVHWEDFFRNFFRKKQKTVRFTHTRRFIRHMRHLYKCKKTKDLTTWFSMPKPLTKIKIDY